MPDIISLWVVSEQRVDEGAKRGQSTKTVVSEWGALWASIEIRTMTFFDACGDLDDLICTGVIVPKPEFTNHAEYEAALDVYLAKRHAAREQGWPEPPMPNWDAVTDAELAEWKRLQRPQVEGIGLKSPAAAEALYRALCALGPEAMTCIASNQYLEIAYWNMRATAEEATRRGACMFIETT